MTGLRSVRYIDLPMMMPAIGVTYFIRFIDSFRVFDNVYTLVGPGAGGSTTTMSIYIYRAFFRVGDIGLAVAASMLLLVASFAVLYLDQPAHRRGGSTCMMHSRGMMALRWVVFALAAFIMNFPVISTLVTSLKSEAEIASYPGLWIESPTLENYREIFRMSDRFDITHYLYNSLVMSLIGAGLSLLLAFPAAYAMVRFEVGNKWLMPTIVNLRAIPLIIFAIPIYLMYQQVDLLDTRLGMGFIQCLVNLPLVLVLLATSIAELPEEIEEAARVDGASTIQILVRGSSRRSRSTSSPPRPCSASSTRGTSSCSA